MKLGEAAAALGEAGSSVSLPIKSCRHPDPGSVDKDGRGSAGAIFQLAKGQGELVRDSLKAEGVSPGSGEDQPTKPSTAEVTDENN